MIIVFVPGDEMALEAQGYRRAMAGEIFGRKRVTPLKTDEFPLKINGWFRCIPYSNSPFFGGHVSFQGCTCGDFFVAIESQGTNALR